MALCSHVLKAASLAVRLNKFVLPGLCLLFGIAEVHPLALTRLACSDQRAADRDWPADRRPISRPDAPCVHRTGELAGAVQNATSESVQFACVDRSYTGEEPASEAEDRGVRLEMVKHPGAKKGFVLFVAAPMDVV
jgi:hypothetical protein